MLICTLFDFGLPMHLTSFLSMHILYIYSMQKTSKKYVAFIPQASLWVFATNL